MRILVLGLTAAAFLAGCGGGGAPVEAENTGPWDLKGKESSILYTTVKNNSIAETNSFSLFSGEVSNGGDVQIDIALNSVKTNIDTRDERMKKFVFKTVDYPSAVINATLPMAEFSALSTGERKFIVDEITVALAGKTASFETQFLVTRLGANKVLVESAIPIMVEADDFDLGAGVDKLQELAKLDSITPVVPVTFSLVFKR